MLRRLVITLCALACACDPIGLADGGLDGSSDAAIPLDGALLDAAAPTDAAAPDGAAADAAAPSDGAAEDGGGFCVCERIECTVTSCDGETCVYLPAPDGTPCGIGGTRRCIDGACVVGVCGDGFREPGPEPEREGCDDGNATVEDACAPDCTATPLIISSRDGEEDVPAFVAVAADNRGELLFVWSASAGDDLELRARRVSAAGVPVDRRVPTDAFILLDGGLGRGWDPHPSVAGLASGWAVTWAARGADASEAGIRHRIIRADGSTTVPRRANEYELGRQATPAIARTLTGFIVAWADESGTLTPPGESRLRYREFDNLGLPTTMEQALTLDGTSGREIFLASNGDLVLAIWTEDSSVPFGRPSIVARRLGGSAPDATPFTVSETDGGEPSAAFLDSGDFAVAWVSRTADTHGDIHTRVVHATGDPLAGTTVVPLTMTPSMGTPVAELAPAVLPLTGAEYLVTYEDGGRRRGVSLIQVGSSPLAPELPTLQGHLQSGLQDDVSLLRTPRGYWFAWSDAGTLGVPGALRSFVAYLLPPS